MKSNKSCDKSQFPKVKLTSPLVPKTPQKKKIPTKKSDRKQKTEDFWQYFRFIQHNEMIFVLFLLRFGKKIIFGGNIIVRLPEGSTWSKSKLLLESWIIEEDVSKAYWQEPFLAAFLALLVQTAEILQNCLFLAIPFNIAHIFLLIFTSKLSLRFPNGFPFFCLSAFLFHFLRLLLLQTIKIKAKYWR